MARQEHEYILGTDVDELRRLGFQHQVWAEETAALWRRAGFGNGQTIVDLGCGPGLATLDLARLVGRAGRVVAVDVSSRFLAHLNDLLMAAAIDNVDVRETDVRQIGGPEALVDGIFARWIFSFLERPDEVVRRVASMIKPGGSFAVLDYFNYHAAALEPPDQTFDRIFRGFLESVRSAGGDYYVGGKMAQYMHSAGLEVTSIVPVCRIARPGTNLWHWLTSFMVNYVPRMVRHGFVTDEEHASFVQLWARRSADPAAFCFPPPMIAVVGVKP